MGGCSCIDFFDPVRYRNWLVAIERLQPTLGYTTLHLHANRGGIGSESHSSSDTEYGLGNGSEERSLTSTLGSVQVCLTTSIPNRYMLRLLWKRLFR